MSKTWRSRGPSILFLAVAATLSRPAFAQSQAPIAEAAPEPPPGPAQQALLRQGENVTLRVRRVIPFDGLSSGERLLSGLPPVARGDRVVAEVVAPASRPPALVGGTVVGIVPPRRFGRPGQVTLELGQLVQAGADGQTMMVPWIFDLEDKRFDVQLRRRLMMALFAAEGAGVGASLGAQTGGGNPVALGAGAGLGLLSGVGYMCLMPGREPLVEVGDTFQVTVGTLSYRPVEPSTPLPLHPGANPWKKHPKGKP